jgi:hypothetical protein
MFNMKNENYVKKKFAYGTIGRKLCRIFEKCKVRNEKKIWIIERELSQGFKAV